MDEVVPFGDRLLRLLDALQPARSQKWLAEQSGLSPGTISRFMQGTRNPDVTSIEALAPVLGVKPDELVRGTDAENRLEGQREWVRRKEFDTALDRILELEQALNEARRDSAAARERQEAESKLREDAEKRAQEYFQQLQDALRTLAFERDDRRQLSLRHEELRAENQQARRQLASAVLEIHSLGERLEQAKAAIEKLDRTSTLTKVLAGAAAAASAYTAVKLMTQDDDDDEEEEEGDDDLEE